MKRFYDPKLAKYLGLPRLQLQQINNDNKKKDNGKCKAEDKELHFDLSKYNANQFHEVGINYWP